jgi:DNA modification methylase
MSNTLLVNGNAKEIPLADGSVHMVVTSPPY